MCITFLSIYSYFDLLSLQNFGFSTDKNVTFSKENHTMRENEKTRNCKLNCSVS